MTYLIFMSYIMLVAICGNMNIIVGESTWLILDILGVIALIVHCYKSEKERRKDD